MSEPQLAIQATRRCALVLLDFQNGITAFDAAVGRLRAIEEKMFEENPDAEPDGDITYAVATARERLEQLFIRSQGTTAPTPDASLTRRTTQRN